MATARNRGEARVLAEVTLSQGQPPSRLRFVASVVAAGCRCDARYVTSSYRCSRQARLGAATATCRSRLAKHDIGCSCRATDRARWAPIAARPASSHRLAAQLAPVEDELRGSTGKCRRENGPEGQAGKVRHHVQDAPSHAWHAPPRASRNARARANRDLGPALTWLGWRQGASAAALAAAVTGQRLRFGTPDRAGDPAQFGPGDPAERDRNY